MNEVRPLTVVQTLSRLALIGVALLAVVAAFAYAGGWLSPARLTQTKMVAAIQAGIGDHPGFRRAHAKGMCIAGWFDSSGAAVPWSKAAVFAQGRVPLIGRVALASGLPFQSDASVPVRSMALRFMQSDGAEWRTGMNDIPVFVVNSAAAFYEQLVASKHGGVPVTASGNRPRVRPHQYASARRRVCRRHLQQSQYLSSGQRRGNPCSRSLGCRSLAAGGGSGQFAG
jgi:catalase